MLSAEGFEGPVSHEAKSAKGLLAIRRACGLARIRGGVGHGGWAGLVIAFVVEEQAGSGEGGGDAAGDDKWNGDGHGKTPRWRHK